MNSARWQQVKGLFERVVELAPDERRHLLDKSCESDTELRREVEKLLVASDQAESFMESPAIGEVAEVIEGNGRKLKEGVSFGHYEIIRQIGAGGMGEVYLALDTKLDRRVAVKILNEQFSRDESDLHRFIQEARAASALNHPNILVIHEIGESENSNYIVSEFIEGKTLRETVKGSPMKPSEILDIAIQIANALTVAHTAKIVHRDIKPDNIMLRPDGYVKILDFGLAKLVEQKLIGLEDATVKQNQTAQGVILGTVNYMSPEQAKGEKVDERTDIFSFGTVLYEMITGQTPFAGNTMSETFANLINAEPPPLSRFSSNVPEELKRIVSKTLRKNKDKRYQTMRELLADLRDLRENLAFDEKLEKLHPPNDKNATAFLSTKTGVANHRTEQTNYNFTPPPKRHRSFAGFTLAVLLIGVIGFGYYFYASKKSVSSANVKKTLAVLPFVNAAQDANAEYLSDGITESIINNLSQLSSLKVMSRNSAFRFKDNQTDTKNIASQLGVEALVTGDIKQLGDKFVINVRLIDASDGSQIWGSQYIKSASDVITAQNEIAQAVAQNLRVKLSNSEQQRLAKNYTENPQAYQLYLRGRFHVFKLTPPEINKAISYFQQAIEIDPNYAPAFVGMSEAYRSLALGSEMLPTEFLPKSQAAANRAIEIDETLAEGHSSLGATLFWKWNWNEAENQLKRALELNPNSANAHLFYAHLLSNTGRHTEALAQIKLANELDPLFPFGNTLEGQFLLHAGRPDEALDKLQKTYELAPNFWLPHVIASSVYTEKEMYAEAIAEARQARELSPFQTVSISYEAYALAISGKNDEARNLVNELLKLTTTRFVPPYHIATIYNGLGERDKTFEWLEKGYEQQDPKMAFLKVDPKLNKLRNDPQFIDLMKRMRLQQ